MVQIRTANLCYFYGYLLHNGYFWALSLVKAAFIIKIFTMPLQIYGQLTLME